MKEITIKYIEFDDNIQMEITDDVDIYDFDEVLDEVRQYLQNEYEVYELTYFEYEINE